MHIIVEDSAAHILSIDMFCPRVSLLNLDSLLSVQQCSLCLIWFEEWRRVAPSLRRPRHVSWLYLCWYILSIECCLQSDNAPRIAVVALGGNALQKRNEPATIEGQVYYQLNEQSNGYSSIISYWSTIAWMWNAQALALPPMRPFAMPKQSIPRALSDWDGACWCPGVLNMQLPHIKWYWAFINSRIHLLLNDFHLPHKAQRIKCVLDYLWLILVL